VIAGRRSLVAAASRGPADPEVSTACPFDVWWFRPVPPRQRGESALTLRMRDRRFAVPLPREGYFQVPISRRGSGPAGRGHRGVRENVAGSARSSPTGCTNWRAWTRQVPRRAAEPVAQMASRRADCASATPPTPCPRSAGWASTCGPGWGRAATLLADPLRRGRPTPAQLAEGACAGLAATWPCGPAAHAAPRGDAPRDGRGAQRSARPMIGLFSRAPRLNVVPAQLLGSACARARPGLRHAGGATAGLNRDPNNPHLSRRRQTP